MTLSTFTNVSDGGRDDYIFGNERPPRNQHPNNNRHLQNNNNQLALLDFDIEAFLGDDPEREARDVASILNMPPQAAASAPSMPPPSSGHTVLPTTGFSSTRQRQTRQGAEMARSVIQRVVSELPDVPTCALPAGLDRRRFRLMMLDYVLSQWRTRDRGDIPLHKYAMKGNVACLSRTADLMKLFKHTTHVNTRNWRGETPLHVVTCPRAAAALLERGASLDARDAMNNTPIHTAARYHRINVLHVLLQHCRDVTLLDGKNVEGFTALHLTVIQQPARDPHRLVLSALVDASVDVNVADDTGGRTALFHAVLRGDEATVRMLVDNNAAVNKADFSDTTPLQAAEDLLTDLDGGTHICSILLEKGGFKLPPSDRITHRSITPSRARKRAKLN